MNFIIKTTKNHAMTMVYDDFTKKAKIQSVVEQIERLVDKILAVKNQNPQADTSHWEKWIDNLVYELYDLTEEEIKIVESQK